MHPFLLRTEWLTLPTYGVLYLTAYLAAIFTAAAVGRHSGIPFSRTVDLGFMLSIAGEVGSRTTFLVVEWHRFAAGTITWKQFFYAGRVVLGGVVAALVFTAWYCRRHRVPFLSFTDAAFTGTALGMGIGRIGCLMAGCCFGAPTDLAWGIVFTSPEAHRLSGTPLGVALHPTQILQSLNGFALFAVLLWLHRRRRFAGETAGIFLVWTGVVRFAVEFLRGDPRGGFGGLATSQWIGIAFALGGVAWLVYAARRGQAPTLAAPPAARRRRAAPA